MLNIAPNEGSGLSGTSAVLVDQCPGKRTAQQLQYTVKRTPTRPHLVRRAVESSGSVLHARVQGVLGMAVPKGSLSRPGDSGKQQQTRVLQELRKKVSGTLVYYAWHATRTGIGVPWCWCLCNARSMSVNMSHLRLETAAYDLSLRQQLS